MKNVDTLIIERLADCTPYALPEITKVFSLCGESFDKTLVMLRNASKLGKHPLEMITTVQSFPNILERANAIINERSEEKEREYGPMSQTMEHMRDIFNSITGEDLSTQDMYMAMVAMKLARERYKHKQDNLLDAVAYLGGLDNYEKELK